MTEQLNNKFTKDFDQEEVSELRLLYGIASQTLIHMKFHGDIVLMQVPIK